MKKSTIKEESLLHNHVKTVHDDGYTKTKRLNKTFMVGETPQLLASSVFQ